MSRRARTDLVIEEPRSNLNERAKAADHPGAHGSPTRSARSRVENWDYQGIVAYSKICTHVGCPIALYEQQTHHLLCPCHQSTFDLADNGKVIFGPAARRCRSCRSPWTTRATWSRTSGFREPVGPSFWERG